MHRVTSTLVVILALSITAFAQGKSNAAISNQIKALKAEKYLQLNYDKSANFTKIMAFGEDFGSAQDKINGLSSLSFGMTFNYQGDTLTVAPESFILTFWAKSDKHKFATSNSLKVIVSGVTLNLGDARYATKAREKDMEYLNFVISRANLEGIARGNSAQMILGNTKFTFTQEHIKLFRHLLNISDPQNSV
jgi:hypothetical protein